MTRPVHAWSFMGLGAEASTLLSCIWGDVKEIVKCRLKTGNPNSFLLCKNAPLLCITAKSYIAILSNQLIVTIAFAYQKCSSLLYQVLNMANLNILHAVFIKTSLYPLVYLCRVLVCSVAGASDLQNWRSLKVVTNFLANILLRWDM